MSSCLRCHLSSRTATKLAITTFAFLHQASGSAAIIRDATSSSPQVYTPERIHVTAQLHSSATYPGEPSREPLGSIEAWYFKDSCIVKQTYQLTNGPAEQLVYFYQYNADLPASQPAFQQWGTPRAKEFWFNNPPELPPEAVRINPLWYTKDLKDRLSSDEQVQVQPLADGRMLGDGPDVEIYFNNDRTAGLWLSPEATSQLQKFYERLMH